MHANYMHAHTLTCTQFRIHAGKTIRSRILVLICFIKMRGLRGGAKGIREGRMSMTHAIQVYTAYNTYVHILSYTHYLFIYFFSFFFHFSFFHFFSFFKYYSHTHVLSLMPSSDEFRWIWDSGTWTIRVDERWMKVMKLYSILLASWKGMIKRGRPFRMPGNPERPVSAIFLFRVYSLKTWKFKLYTTPGASNSQ